MLKTALRVLSNYNRISPVTRPKWEDIALPGKVCCQGNRTSILTIWVA
jgi:hypothetical protein